MKSKGTRYYFKNVRDKYDAYIVVANTYDEAFNHLIHEVKKPWMYQFDSSRKVYVW